MRVVCCLLLFLWATYLCRADVPVLHCVGCENVTCPPEPTHCILDRVPCGCCNVCSLGAGDPCFGFSSSCGPGLVCLTPAGTYDERPPWFSVFHGVCVRPQPTLAPPLQTLAPTPIPIGRK